MSNEEALISRRFFPIDQGRVVMDEEWDLAHPRCPFVVSPFYNQLQAVQNPYKRQVVMTNEEYAERFGLNPTGE